MTILDDIVDNDTFSNFLDKLIYLVLMSITIVSITFYMPYWLEGNTKIFVTDFALSLIFSSVIIGYLYTKGKSNYFKELVVSRSYLRKELEIKNIEEMLSEQKSKLRMKYFGKTLIHISLFLVIFYLYFFGNSLVRQLSFIAFVGYSIIYYNMQKVDPQEVKDSMKYDRQYVNLDGGIAAATSDMKNV